MGRAQSTEGSNPRSPGRGDVTLSVELPLVEGDGGQRGSGLFEGRGLAPSGLEDLKALLTQIGQQDHYQAVLGM